MKCEKNQSYAFCLFCSCFRSQEILFIFIEAKDFPRNSFSFVFQFRLTSGLSLIFSLSPCQVRVPCAVYCWCCCLYTFCTFSNSQSENLTFSVYVIFLRTITIFGPYMSTSNQHSCPFSNVRCPRRRHHFYFTCECETGERTEHDRYMNGINAQLSSMVTQQNHKLNIASAN